MLGAQRTCQIGVFEKELDELDGTCGSGEGVNPVPDAAVLSCMKP